MDVLCFSPDPDFVLIWVWGHEQSAFFFNLDNISPWKLQGEMIFASFMSSCFCFSIVLKVKLSFPKAKHPSLSKTWFAYMLYVKGGLA
jgi:hypothetical protein